MTAHSTQLSSPKRAIPPALWMGLLIAVLLDAPVQLLWKSVMAKAGVDGPGGAAMGERIHWVVTQPRVWILLCFFAAQFFNWMWVLTLADLSFAQPFTALSYLTVGSGAAFFFHEHLSVWRIAGIGLILAGVLLVSSTPHRTVAPVNQ